MRPPDHHDVSGDEPQIRRRDYSLFFFQTEGSRTYFRFTRLGVILIVLLTVIPLVALFVLLLASSRSPASNVNANVRVLPAATPFTPDKPIIQKAPPLRTPPKVGKQPGYGMPAPSGIPTPGKDFDVQPTPKQQVRPPT